MDPGLFVQMIWPLAADEAIAGEFECIEPPHIFNAILKCAELDDSDFKRMAKDDVIGALLAKERDATRDKLGEHRIEVPDGSTQIRRALRERLGSGGHATRRRRSIHRSGASREITHTAEDAAQQSGARYMTASHLLDALLDAPGTAMVNVLAEAGASGVHSAQETPRLDKYGRDITALARDGTLPPPNDRDSDPVSKVVMEELFSRGGKSVLLVQAGERAPDEIIAQVAHQIVCDSPPKGASRKRIVELTLAKVGKGTKSSQEVETRLMDLLREASESGNVLLWFSSFHRFLAVDKGKLGERLKERLLGTGITAIASMKERAFTKNLKHDTAWKDVFHTVWIHDLDAPMQL